MKIVIVSPAYPLRGGIAHFTALLASALRSRHSVEIITFKRQYPALLFPGKTQEEADPIPGLEPAPQLIDSLNPVNWIAVGNLIRRRNADLILFRFWMPFFGPAFGTIARIARRNRKTRIGFICDNIIPHEHRPGDRALTRYALSSADFFIVQSRAVERELMMFRKDPRYRLVPHPVYEIFGKGVNRQQARERLGVSGNVMLFFGYIREYKGLHVLLNAMTLLGSEYRLMVVGEFYEPEESYRATIDTLGLSARIIVRSGYLPNSQVAEYFSAADVVVLPYRTGSQSGITQIAYNFDRSVITTDVGGVAEVVRDGITGFVIPPDDPERLADAIRRFFEGERRDEFEQNVSREKSKYSWEAMATAIEEMAGLE